MMISHLLALIPLLVFLILSLVFYGKGLIHLITLGYTLTLAIIAVTGEWEILFYAPIIGTSAIAIILFIFSMTRGNWL